MSGEILNLVDHDRGWVSLEKGLRLVLGGGCFRGQVEGHERVGRKKTAKERSLAGLTSARDHHGRPLLCEPKDQRRNFPRNPHFAKSKVTPCFMQGVTLIPRLT